MTVDALAPTTTHEPTFAPSMPSRSAPPGWLLFLVIASAGGMLTFGSAGLLLAVNDAYRPALAFPLGAVLWVVLLWLAQPLYRKDPTAAAAPRAGHRIAVVAVAIVALVTAWNALNASQHVLINRDGGSYANTGRWIARDGSLEVRSRVGPFASEPSLQFDSYAVYNTRDGTEEFQFSHLLPVVLAEAYAVGGDRGFFRVPPILGGIALLSFFALAWLLFRRPLFALSAMLALAFIVPQVSYSRDSYSEIASQVLVFAALVCLVKCGIVRSWRVALVAGLFFGAIEATRVDGMAWIVGLPIAVAVAWVRADPEHAKERVRAVLALVLGIVPGLVLGLVDLMHHSGEYFHAFSRRVRYLSLATIAISVVCVVAVAVWPHARRLGAHLPWRAIANAAGAIVAIVGVAAWVARPSLQTVRAKPIGLVEGLQHLEGDPVDGTRRYSEHSMQWMWWYLGYTTLAAAIAGAAFTTRDILLGRASRYVTVLCVLVPGSLLFLWKAGAAPDHVWVDRRFLVGAFPLLILLALAFAVMLWDWGGAGRQVARVGAVVIAVLAVAHPLYTLRHVASMSEQRRFYGVIQDACGVLGPHAAVVVLESEPGAPSQLFDDWTPQTFRSWCGADVAVMRGTPDRVILERLGREWQQHGRQLFVVAAAADTITSALPDANVTPTRIATSHSMLEATLARRPAHLRSQSFQMALAPVPIP
jgi:hypothetical protein